MFAAPDLFGSGGVEFFEGGDGGPFGHVGDEGGEVVLKGWRRAEKQGQGAKVSSAFLSLEITSLCSGMEAWDEGEAGERTKSSWATASRE